MSDIRKELMKTQIRIWAVSILIFLVLVGGTYLVATTSLTYKAEREAPPNVLEACKCLFPNKYYIDCLKGYSFDEIYIYEEEEKAKSYFKELGVMYGRHTIDSACGKWFIYLPREIDMSIEEFIENPQ